MIKFSGQSVYLACGATDMRKQINGLAAIVENTFELDPFRPSLFVFCNRARNRLKVLEWDRDGFWLYFKRLERGHFSWPAASGDEATITLTDAEFSTLLGATSVERLVRREQVKYASVG